MGIAIDTIVGAVTMPTTAPALANITLANGDSDVVRSFNSPATALLEQVFGNAAHAFQFSVRSPFFYDNIRGYQSWVDDLPVQYGIPQLPLEYLRSQDALTIQANGTASDVILLALSIYYTDLMGQAQNLAHWGDIAGRIKHIYNLEVDCTSGATPGTWVDTAINATVDQLKGNTDHAILGFLTNSEIDVVAVKGQFSGSLRIGAPGVVNSYLSVDYWKRMSDNFGTPHIPIFNSADKANTFVSVAHHAASQSVKVGLTLAELG